MYLRFYVLACGLKERRKEREKEGGRGKKRERKGKKRDLFVLPLVLVLHQWGHPVCPDFHLVFFNNMSRRPFHI